jgi:hypothetical protein
MPVIGRLDGQVEDVLIKPVSRRGRGEEEETPAPEKEETPDHTPSQTPPVDESSANTDELPVWLL